MAEQAKDAPPRDKKKLFIIGAAVAALLVIAVAGWVLVGSSKAEKGPAEKGKTEGKAEGGKGEGKAGEAGASSIYPLEPFIVNIYDGQEIRYLKVKVEFELTNPQAKGDLDAKVAPLRDAILILLTTKTMQEIQDLQGKNQLREQILAAVGKIVPPSKVAKVYFTDFVVQ
jgi:flagellar FliL protein